MVTIQDKSQCCGCNACGDICPKGAISYKVDQEGFWYPMVDKDKCVGCGLCEKVCPILNLDTLKHNDFDTPQCYAAYNKNLEVRFDSTSGGLFSAFADVYYRAGGYVGGAVANQDGSVHHFVSNNKSDLHDLRRSKYQQSDLQGFYSKIRELLDAGEKVLVCGCPCQMSALRAFLMYKDYPNLLILDFVCRGINSPLTGQKFREYLGTQHGSPVKAIRAKNKELGWDKLTMKVWYEDGSIEYQTSENNLSTKGYLGTGAFCRPSCYECRFKGFPRISDITLADFWGIKDISREMYDNVGTSLVLINSEKGRNAFNLIQQKIKAIELPYQTALQDNPALLKPLPKPKINRKIFFQDVHDLDYGKLAEKYFPPITPPLTVKRKIVILLRIVRGGWGLSKWYQLTPKWQFIKYNFLRKNIKTNFWNYGLIFPKSNCIIKIDKRSNIVINSRLTIGLKKFEDSKLETRLLVESGASLIVDSPYCFFYGSDVEVFKNSTLHINGAGFHTYGGTNINFNLICGNNIEIGYNVMIGRNVTIRDNNGGHFLNQQGYKLSKPVKIGNHVWICEGATIMQGVKIGDGAVIGAHSIVYSNVPANTLVSGNPARVVETGIEWKY